MTHENRVAFPRRSVGFFRPALGQDTVSPARQIHGNWVTERKKTHIEHFATQVVCRPFVRDLWQLLHGNLLCLVCKE